MTHRSGFEIDALLAARPFGSMQREQTLSTLAVHGLDGQGNEPPALTFGSGGLALNGLCPRIGNIVPGTPDVDTVVPDVTYDRLSGPIATRQHYPYDMHKMRKLAGQAALEVSLYAGTLNGPVEASVGARRYVDAVKHAVMTPYGIPTPPISWIAQHKALTGRPQDISSLVLAQIVATQEQHPALQDGDWQRYVAIAVRRARAQAAGYTTRRNLPNWLRQLAQADFRHPAFQDIPRLSTTPAHRAVKVA